MEGIVIPKAAIDTTMEMNILVHMGGEVTFSIILEQFPTPQTIAGSAYVEGITYRFDDCFKTIEPRERIKIFDIVKSRYLKGVFHRVIKRYGYFIIGMLEETKRGFTFRDAVF